MLLYDHNRTEQIIERLRSAEVVTRWVTDSRWLPPEGSVKVKEVGPERDRPKIFTASAKQGRHGLPIQY